MEIGQKELKRMPSPPPGTQRGMARRAQTIGSKDAGFFIAKLGLGPGDSVLEAGIGSGGLSMYIQRVLGTKGTHVSVEPRGEHSEVALENLQRAAACWDETPDHHHIEGTIEASIEAIKAVNDGFHAIVLDLPEHPPPFRRRLNSFCPVDVSHAIAQLVPRWSELGKPVKPLG